MHTASAAAAVTPALRAAAPAGRAATAAMPADAPVAPPQPSTQPRPQPPAAAQAGHGTAARLPWRMRLLAWSFALFNALRTVSYLPNLWQIVQSGRSDQHSLLTWLCFTGANLSTAWWVWEANGGRMDRVVAVSLANALLCALTGVVIVWYRWS